MTPPPQNADSQADERELQVRRELHALKLASAAAVLRDGITINVRVAPTSAEQAQQLTLALDKIPGVKLSFLRTQREYSANAIPSQPSGH